MKTASTHVSCEKKSMLRSRRKMTTSTDSENSSHPQLCEKSMKRRNRKKIMTSTDTENCSTHTLITDTVHEKKMLLSFDHRKSTGLYDTGPQILSPIL